MMHTEYDVLCPELGGLIADEIREAVAAETERCATIDPRIVACPICKVPINTSCPTYPNHEARFAAGIRATDGSEPA